jgi:hypothetical protein
MLLILLLVIAIANVGCEPVGEDYVFGDSLGAQIGPAIEAENDGRVWQVMNGADLAYWQVEVNKAIDSGARSITLAISGNDAGTWKSDGGWTDADEARWRDTIDRAHAAKVCVAGVLPWFTDKADEIYPGVLAEVDEARAAMLDMPFDSLVDWRPPIEAEPEIMSPHDGIHIAAFGPEYTHPVAVRYNVVDSAANGCL